MEIGIGQEKINELLLTAVVGHNSNAILRAYMLMYTHVGQFLGMLDSEKILCINKVKRVYPKLITVIDSKMKTKVQEYDKLKDDMARDKIESIQNTLTQLPMNMLITYLTCIGLSTGKIPMPKDRINDLAVKILLFSDYTIKNNIVTIEECVEHVRDIFPEYCKLDYNPLNPKKGGFNLKH